MKVVTQKHGFDVGDLVEVETKFHGKKIGTIIEQWEANRSVKDLEVFDTAGKSLEANRGVRCSWIVHIPNHWTSSTIVDERDMEVVS